MAQKRTPPIRTRVATPSFDENIPDLRNCLSILRTVKAMLIKSETGQRRSRIVLTSFWQSGRIDPTGMPKVNAGKGEKPRNQASRTGLILQSFSAVSAGVRKN